MSSKKSLITIVVVIVILVAGALLWNSTRTVSVPTSSTGGTTPGSQSGVGGQNNGQAGKGSIGKMTDDIYIELIVQAAYQAQKNPATYASTMNNLYDKYGITAENVTAYGEALSKDPARAQAIAQRYTQQLQQLMKK